MLLAMTDYDCCDWRLELAHAPSFMRSGLGTDERRPAFAPALLRVCPYIFLSRPTFEYSTLFAQILDHTSSTMPKVGKPISKRTSTRLRNSIQKKSAEKQRKLRKQAKNVRQLFHRHNSVARVLILLFLEPRMEI